MRIMIDTNVLISAILKQGSVPDIVLHDVCENHELILCDHIISESYDVPCLQQMLEVYQRWGGTVLGVQEVRAEDTGKYGMVRPEHVGPGLYRVQDLVEKPRPEEAPST